MPVDLSKPRFIEIEDLIEMIIHALRHKEPFSLTRWADSSNWIMNHGREGGPSVAYREGRLSLRYWPEYRQAFVYGAQTCDVLGVFLNDSWTTDVMTKLVPDLDLTDKPLVYAWCNRFIFSRREAVEEILERPWRTAVIGNTVSKFRLWLAEHFPKLEIVQSGTASDWPDIAQQMRLFARVKPELALISAGWFTSCLVGAARDAGTVAISCGHIPDWWLHHPPESLPNTEFPRGPDGTLAHLRKHYKGGVVHQRRRIVLEEEITDA